MIYHHKESCIFKTAKQFWTWHMTSPTFLDFKHCVTEQRSECVVLLFKPSEDTFNTNLYQLFLFYQIFTFLRKWNYIPLSTVKPTRCTNFSNLFYLYCCLLASKQATVSVWHIPVAVCTVSNSWWWAERLSETFEKLVHLVGFTIGIYYDARPYEHQIWNYNPSAQAPAFKICQ